LITRIVRKRIDNYVFIRGLFEDKSGIEIGGPSGDFKNYGFIPLYKIIKRLDGCNFTNTTIWEGDIESGKQYIYYNNKSGIQFISEATDLTFCINSTYEFVISSNCLEHVANPLKAIEEWIRVTKKDGLLLLILPNKEYCFDHKRPITRFSHLLEDYKNNLKEDDLTHLNEILELHDLKMDKRAGNIETFRERSMVNFKNRALHHHVFNISLLKQIYEFFNLELLLTNEGRRSHVIIGKRAHEP
jgi:SAM-dependent methyltransferase